MRQMPRPDCKNPRWIQGFYGWHLRGRDAVGWPAIENRTGNTGCLLVCHTRCIHIFSNWADGLRGGRHLEQVFEHDAGHLHQAARYLNHCGRYRGGRRVVGAYDFPQSARRGRGVKLAEAYTGNMGYIKHSGLYCSIYTTTCSWWTVYSVIINNINTDTFSNQLITAQISI